MGTRLKLEERTSGVTDRLWDVGTSATAIGGANFLAVGDNGWARVSTDAITWSTTTPPPSSAQYLGAFSDGTYWYVGGRDASQYGCIWRSNDLSSWAKVFTSSSTSLYPYVRGIYYDGSSYMAWGDGGLLLTSPDGSSWTQRTPPGTSTTQLISGIVGNGSGRWVLAKSEGLWYSDDAGLNWTPITVPANTYGFWKIEWNGSYFFVRAANDTNARMVLGPNEHPVRYITSTDGENWDVESGYYTWQARALYGGSYFWDSGQNKWIIGGNHDWGVHIGSGSRTSLAFEELPYKAGFAAARDGISDNFNGGGAVNGGVAFVGEDGMLVSGRWVTESYAESPSPAHQEYGQLLPPTVSTGFLSLSWSGGSGEVFFGENPDFLSSQGTQSSPWTIPWTLTSNQTFYWRVDIGGVQGNVWRFHTDPADTSQKLHTHGGTWGKFNGSQTDVTTVTSWTDIITFNAADLAGGHRYLLSLAAMTFKGYGDNGSFYIQVYSVDANGLEQEHKSAFRMRVAPYDDSGGAQQKLQGILIPSAGESIRVKIKDWSGSVAYLVDTWATLIDLDSPGMVEGTDWGMVTWSGGLITDNSNADDSYPVLDLEWTPDGESDYVVWAGARWNNGIAALDPHGYRLRDYDTDQILALTGHLHNGPSTGFEDGNASVHAFKKPDNAVKHLRMDVWGYDYDSSGGNWQLTDASLIWFRVSKMQNYSIAQDFRRKIIKDSNREFIPDYDHGQVPHTIKFRPDPDGTAVFFSYLQGMWDTRNVGRQGLGMVQTFGDFGQHQQLYAMSRTTPARGQVFNQLVEVHCPPKTWKGSNRQRISIVGVYRTTGLANETRNLNTWATGNGTTYLTHRNVVAFGELYNDAGGKPGIQQVVPTPARLVVPISEPITFRVATENGAKVDLVKIKRRYSPQKPKIFGTTGASSGSVASNGSGVLCTATTDGTVHRSIDGGETWAGYTLPLCSASPSPYCRAVLWNPVISKFVGVNDYGIVFRSDDATGTSWSEVDLGSADRLYNIACNSSGRMIIVEQHGDTWWSDDAVNWNNVSTGAYRLFDIECDGTTFVAVGRYGAVYTTTDGTSWTSRTNPGSKYNYSVAYGNGIWVITDLYTNQVFTATDPTSTWTARDLGHDCWPYRVFFGNGEFVLQSYVSAGESEVDRFMWNRGGVWASTDAIEWTQVGYSHPDESSLGVWGDDYRFIMWDGSFVDGNWWLPAHPTGSLLKISGSEKFLGESWEDVIIDNVFQGDWDGEINPVGGIDGMVEVSITPGANLRYWTNYLLHVEASGAGAWKTITNPATQGSTVAISDDGVILMNDYNRVLKTTDRGATWSVLFQDASLTGLGLRCVAMTPDGEHIVAAGFNTTSPPTYSPIWISHDAGNTWTQASGYNDKPWENCAISDDGQSIGVTARPHSPTQGYLFYSTDGGSSWSYKGTGGTGGGYQLAVSRDGSTFIHEKYVSSDWWIEFSTNGGVDWNTYYPPGAGTITGIGTNDDGQVMAVAFGSSGTGQFFLSTNYGSSFVQSYGPSSGGRFGPIAVSPDGQGIAVSSNYGNAAWRTEDQGFTWIGIGWPSSSLHPIYSGDGKFLAGADYSENVQIMALPESMEPYEWDFNTQAEKLTVLKVAYQQGYAVSGYSTQHEEIPNSNSQGYIPILNLPTDMVTNGHRYLVFATAQTYGTNGYEPMCYSTRDNIVDAEVYARSETGNPGVGFHMQSMRQYALRENEAFEWWCRVNSVNINYNSAIRNSHLVALDLDSPGLTENTNWWYAEVTDDAADVPAGWNHDYAGVTFSEIIFDAVAGKDYLVVACCGMGNSTGYSDGAFRIYDETEAVEVARGGHGPFTNTTIDRHCNVQAAVITPIASGSHKVRIDMDGGGYFDHQFTSLFVFKMSTVKQYVHADDILNESGLSIYVYPHASGNPTPKQSVTLPGDSFGQLLAFCITQADNTTTTTGISPNTMLNGSRFADTQQDGLGSTSVNYSSAVCGQQNYGGGDGRPSAVIVNHSSSARAGDNDLDMYVGAVNTGIVLERAAIIALGTELQPILVPLGLESVDVQSSTGDITLGNAAVPLGLESCNAQSSAEVTLDNAKVPLALESVDAQSSAEFALTVTPGTFLWLEPIDVQSSAQIYGLTIDRPAVEDLIPTYSQQVGGSGMVHGVQLHPGVPDHVLTHDDVCRRIEKKTGANNARILFRRTPNNLTGDVSVRIAASLGLKNTAKHSVGIGALMESVTYEDSNKLERLSTDGYHLMLLDTVSSQYELRLSRTIGDVSTTLWSKFIAGTVGVYRWHQFRLDVLRQLDGSVLLQVWTNDLDFNQANAPIWRKISDDIADAIVPTGTWVGFGSQGFVGSGYAVYVDQFVVYSGS